MILTGVILFLTLSLVFYVLFGGADFGAGILGIMTGKRYRSEIAQAIGPVWEANHVWLILVLVILFMGFPRIYSQLSLNLHIPILLLLMGIIFRGTAFTFMHYDAIKDKSVTLYDWAFRISSVISPLFIGVIVGASMMGRINPEATTFHEAFIYPWFNGFSFSVGIFTICLFTFLAAVFMVGEATGSDARRSFTKIARRMQTGLILSGLMVFLIAYLYGFPLLVMFLESVAALICITLATLSLPILWYFLNRGLSLGARVVAGAQVLFILIGWFSVQYPVVVRMQGDSGNLSLINTAAPDATLLQLLIALIAGSVVILPSLFYLMKTFKGDQFRRNGTES